MAARAAFDVELARRLIDRRRSTPGAALPILHDLQNQFGYIDDAAIALLADALNISKAEVARRRQLLSRLQAQPGRRTGAEDVPGGIVPGDGMRGTRRPSRKRATESSPTIRRQALVSTSRLSIVSATAHFRPRRSSTASRSAASIATGSTRSWPAQWVRSHERARSSFPRIPQPFRSAPTQWPRLWRARRGGAASI